MSTVEKKEGADLWTDTAPHANNAHMIVPSIARSENINNPIASQFCSLLSEGEAVSFQTFDDDKKRKDPNLVRVLHGTLEQHLPLLTQLNEAGAGVFVTVNETDLQGRGTNNIIGVRAVFVDLDGAPLAPILSAPLEPHMTVESSPGRYHVYWLVEGMPLTHFSKVQKALIALYGSDPVVHDLPRVMRVPGFLHKKGEPYLVTILESSGTLPYKSEDFLERFAIDVDASPAISGPKLGVADDPILQELNKRKMVKRPLPSKPGAWDILCPFVDSHTTGSDGTVYFEAHTNGYKGSGFKCHHAHCSDKGIDDLRGFLGLKNKEVWDVPLPLAEELLPVMPFQEAMLPETLCPWIKDIAERMQIPLDFLASTCVVALGSLIGRKVGIYPKAHDDWLVIPNLWGAIVGRPSMLKSPAIAEMMKPIEELVAKAICSHREESKVYEQYEMWLEAQKSARKEDMKKAARANKGVSEMPHFDPLESTAKPMLKRYKTEDGTVEKIGEILLENPQGILIHRDELVGWLKSLDKAGREGDRAFFLESWNGSGSFTVDRIGRGTSHIPALCLSIIGGIQPGPLGMYVHHAANGGVGDDGLLQRFQMLVWPDTSQSWVNVDRIPDPVARKLAFEVFQCLDAFGPFEPFSNDSFETLKLRFLPEAQILFDEWRVHLEQRLCARDLNSAFESHLAKYRSLMPSLALIFHLVETVGRGCEPVDVSAEAARRAIAWCEYLETHARRLYASGESIAM